MQIIEFYRGERGNTNGDMLDEIMTWTDGQLEMDHDWVQFVFGSNEPSMLNGDAPTMTVKEALLFRESPVLKEKVKKAFVRFLTFLGFELLRDDNEILIKAKEVPWWLRVGFNHNNLRVTRLLKCLRLTGLKHYAVALHDALGEFQHLSSENTKNFWERATYGSLWDRAARNGVNIPDELNEDILV